MLEFENREEHETGGGEKIEQNKISPDITQAKKEAKQLRKERLFICRHCNKEVRMTTLNCVECPYCHKAEPVRPLTKIDHYMPVLFIGSLILLVIFLGAICDNEQTNYQIQKERELRNALDTIGMDKEKIDDIIDTMEKKAGKK